MRKILLALFGGGKTPALAIQRGSLPSGKPTQVNAMGPHPNPSNLQNS